jgi:hypothetical protein
MSVSDKPKVAEIDESYADDISQLESDPKPDVLSGNFNNSVQTSAESAKTKNLVLAPEKSQVTLFTPWTKEVIAVPQVFIDGVPVPLNKKPKPLGVTFDPLFNFGENADDYKGKVDKCVPVMSALGRTSWGDDKETLLFTFNALMKPTLTYCAPIWAPNTKKSNRKKLQLVQNKALRIVTRCHRATSVDHLH